MMGLVFLKRVLGTGKREREREDGGKVKTKKNDGISSFSFLRNAVSQ